MPLAGLKARPQFIRRPEVDTGEVSLFVGEAGRLHRHVGGYEEIVALGLDDLGSRSGTAAAIDEPHYFVCTNGQRDLCCARYGLPVYQGLRERVGMRVWQTTHVGGHRFAPNVLALPQGALYGRVFAEEVDAFLGAVERGQLAVPYLRGRTAYPPAAQVAETLIDGAGKLEEVEGGVVTFATEGGMQSVSVREASAAYEVVASCGKAETETVVPWVAAG